MSNKDKYMISDYKLKCIIDIEDWQMQCCGTPFKRSAL